MGRLHDIAQRSRKFVDNLEAYIAGAIDDNQELIDLNREQLKVEHADVFDQPVRPKYSRSYAAFKGFSTPDLYLTGDLFESFTIRTTGDKQFYIDGHTDYFPDLKAKYGKDVFGIAKSKQTRAKEITTKELAAAYKAVVLQR